MSADTVRCEGKIVCGVVFMPELRLFMIALFEKLREEHPNMIFHGYAATPQEVQFYKKYVDAGILSSVSNSEEYFRNPPAEPKGEALFSEARQWEQTLGCTFARLAVANRHFGRGYALAGPGHPRSRLSQNFDLEMYTRAYVMSCRFWTNEFKTKHFDMILNGGAVVGIFANHHNVPLRCIIGSRYENLHFWAEDYFFYTSVVERYFNSAEANVNDDALARPYMVERTHRKIFNRERQVVPLITLLAKMCVRRAYHWLRGYEKARGYYLSEELSFVYRRWRDTKVMTGPDTVPLEKLENSPFVFFPLHTEPEASVGQISPEFFFQHAAIAALSRDLPAGYTLAVKETIHGVGRRPKDFYQQISDLKNVVWLDMDEYGLEVVKKAAAVATITGTAGFEAAVIGKPVIAFGHHNIYNFLEHVFGPADITDLRSPLSKILDNKVDLAKAARDGQRFLEAVRQTSFDMRGYDYIRHSQFDKAAVSDAASALMTSLSGENRDPHRQIRADVLVD